MMATYFEDTEIFDLDKHKGLQIAFGFTAFDANYDMIDEPQYGEMKLVMKSWGLGDTAGT